MYQNNNQKKLSPELFKNPSSEYRGTPFFAWNCKVNQEILFKHIDYLKEMGMGGFHVHSRTGMGIEYLGDEFMNLVKQANEKAKENDMITWLYDEDRWPSGFAGGYVTKEAKYRSRFLVFTPTQYDQDADAGNGQYSSTGQAQRSNDRRLLARYEVGLKDGCLAGYRRLAEGEAPEKDHDLWFAYLEVAGSSPWFNNQAYVNTLDPEAIQKFVDITHERYYEVLGAEFGKTIPAIFTDEPQFVHKSNLGFAQEKRDIAIPFTDDFEETFVKAYGESLMDCLPELFWELPDNSVSASRYRYHDHLGERFASAFADTIGKWCAAHGIMLTGHMMDEPTLESQTVSLGDAMRAYRAFQLPGIDMLCDGREYATAKQAQSASHQFGRPGVISELYGVTNWDFDFRGHKLQGDWQAALGVTVRVHHLTWMSMAGEAKRDYPASIGYQSPWYKEYPLIENHFSRINTALTRGKARAKVGVVHPIESYWLHFGPEEQTGAVRREMDENFENIVKWLLFGLVDFDFISESLMISQDFAVENQRFMLGEMAYDVVLVPNCETLRTSTIERLEQFVQMGGKVIFAGEPALLLDAMPSKRVRNLAADCMNIPFSKTKILDALEPYREIEIRNEKGTAVGNLLYQMREDGDDRWLFVCHAEKVENPDIAVMEQVDIKVKGCWRPSLYNTMDGEILPIDAQSIGDATVIHHEFSQHDSLLLRLEPGQREMNVKLKDEEKASYQDGDESTQKNDGKTISKDESKILSKAESKTIKKECVLLNPVPVTLSEPNVLVLDLAEYAFDGSAWQPKEEILRIDNQFRTHLGYPLRMEALAQPWVSGAEAAADHRLSLRFSVTSEIEVISPSIALEDAEAAEIIVNGETVDSKVCGWFVDECIKKVAIPNLPKGQTEILLNIPFSPATNVEWCYLLGDFGVRVQGSRATLTEPVRALTFGDWTNQGLPFYAGNVTYHCEVEMPDGNLRVEVPQFRNPLLSVSVDEELCGKIAFAPYRLDAGRVTDGKHRVDITAFGNRVNAFGTLHNCDAATKWYGPNAWRTTGSSWAYEYQLKRTGILVSPRFSIWA